VAWRLVILGPPASGKGTQGVRLAIQLGVPHISAGHLLRASVEEDGDPFGIQRLVDQGRMVPDEVVQETLSRSLGPGFILDGYPRTAVQARWLDGVLQGLGLPLHAALELDVDEEILEARMGLRAKQEKRSDDRPEVFHRRLLDYRRSVSGLRAHYAGRLVEVDGTGSEEEVLARLLSRLPSPHSGPRPHPAGHG
jgi:adenylate kinase